MANITKKTAKTPSALRLNISFSLTVLFILVAISPPGRAAEVLPIAPLPSGVRAVWDLDKATHETTPTRERVCLNGLWQWQPAQAQSEQPPAGNWGWFKVPGPWPSTNAGDAVNNCQTMFAHPSWMAQNLRGLSAAWYQRKFTVPGDWANRRIALNAEYIDSIAVVFVDGRQAGEIRWLSGELDLTSLCQPGSTHTLTLLVKAVPLSAMSISSADTFGTRQVRSTVERRGLCGDVYLSGTPAAARLGDVKVSASVRKWEITFETEPQGMAADATYALRAQVSDHGRSVKEFTSKPFKAADLKDGRIAFTKSWKPKKLWDTITPQNMYDLRLSLLDADGMALDDALPVHFGFRELWIDGRDFYLNGSRIFLSVVPYDNAQIDAAWASYDYARETMQRLKSFGVNFIYTHNYGCTPGTHLSFKEVLRAADDEGMLVAFSLPHFNQYQWGSPDAAQTNGYARHAAFYVRAAENHPSVVFYSTSHNSAGAQEQMNPDLIDGIQDVRDVGSRNNSKKALQAEPIIRHLDPSRIVYHHSAANLGAVYTANFYANFAPMQEMADWFGHWATQGVKPLLLCEYGVPFIWDWGMYRGWHHGARAYGEAVVPWDISIAEWNAGFFGDHAYQLTDLEKESVRWEAGRFKAGAVWQHYEYPGGALSFNFTEQQNQILAMYITESLRAFRTWGIPAFCPCWDHGAFWKLRDGVKPAGKNASVDWDALQRPGFSPDYINNAIEPETRHTWFDTSYERSDWVPTVAGQSLIQNNMPLLAYIGGKPSAFTSKDHNFQPGDTFQKQIIIVNDSRRTVTADCQWSLALPNPVLGQRKTTIKTGGQARLPLSLTLPVLTPPGRYVLSATIQFSDGETQTDSFNIDVIPRPSIVQAASRIALFDPKGETTKAFDALGVQCAPVDANADLSAYDTLIVGKEALTVDGPAPDITRVRDGLKVVLFEQTSPVLEQRFGFRVEEQGLRWVFKRVPDHPLLAGIGEENLRNWRGAATLLSPGLKYEAGPHGLPQVRWCDIPVKRLWRCGNRGNVASVIIEKPARGDFMPILDGGYSLQFSPLLEYREAKGMMLFCQMDVTGRTESDPAAGKLTRNILDYIAAWKPAPHRKVLYAGDPAGMNHLELAGITAESLQDGQLPTDSVLVVGSGAGSQRAAIAGFLKAGGRLLAMGLDEQQANAFLPSGVKMKNAEHIAAFFDAFGKDSPLAGISPADVYNRAPRTMPLVSEGAAIIGNGVLATAQNAGIIFCQLAPYDVADEQAGLSKDEYNIRKTWRRSSYLMTRLLANLGAAGSTPILERFHQPVEKGKVESRCLNGLYLDAPIEWDDPYRFFCW